MKSKILATMLGALGSLGSFSDRSIYDYGDLMRSPKKKPKAKRSKKTKGQKRIQNKKKVARKRNRGK